MEEEIILTPMEQLLEIVPETETEFIALLNDAQLAEVPELFMRHVGMIIPQPYTVYSDHPTEVDPETQDPIQVATVVVPWQFAFQQKWLELNSSH